MITVVSLRDITIRSTLGHTVHISARVPTAIPRDILQEAQALGCVIADQVDPSVLKADNPTTDNVDEQIRAAIEELIAANNEAAFNTDGAPKVKAVREITGLPVTAEQVRAVFESLGE